MSDIVTSSTTPESSFESSNGGRIRRPRGGVRVDFSEDGEQDEKEAEEKTEEVEEGEDEEKR